ncbi:hypothetical protein DAI43_23770 [Achromobacter xylosoxidans]|nr:hypothetical protein DAI43_23770 [Achromobacter xylosoxidans]
MFLAPTPRKATLIELRPNLSPDTRLKDCEPYVQKASEKWDFSDFFHATHTHSQRKTHNPQRYLPAALTGLFLLTCDAVFGADVLYSEYQAKQQQSAFAFPLEEAIALAVRNNRLVKSAYVQRISQKFDLYVSEGKFYPKLLLTTSALTSKVNGTSSNAKDLNTNASVTLPTGATVSIANVQGRSTAGKSSSTSVTLSQPLLKNAGIDANTASVRIARLDDEISRLALKATLSQTVAQVIYAYRELLRAQEQKVIAEAALARNKDLYEVNRSLIAAGRMAKVEILQTQAEVANREVALEEAENQIDAARLALVALLALEPRTPLYATAPTSVDWRPTDPTRALETALTLQPDYLSMKILVERAKISLDYAKNQQLWDLSLVATRTQARSGGASPGAMDIQASGARTGGSHAGLQLTIPFGDRSVKQPEVRASVDLHTQELKLLETRQTVEHRIRDATRNVQTRWRQLELSIKARDLSRQKLEAEKEKLQVGQSSNFQVLSFENDLRNAENARLNAQITYLNTLTELDERMGKTLDVWSIPIIQTNGYEN